MKTVSNKPIADIIPEILPVIPTMDVVVFPQMIVPLLIIDEKIIQGIQKSLEESKLVMLLAAKKQMDNYQGAIGTKDLYKIGTIASVMRIIKIPEGGIKVLVQGMNRARAHDIMIEEHVLNASVVPLNSLQTNDTAEVSAQIKNIKELAERMSLAGLSFSPDFHLIISKMQDPVKIGDFILSHLNLSVEDAQELLEQEHLEHFFQRIFQHLHRELEIAQAQERIKNNARDSMNQSQKEFFLREQLKAIKKELGDDDTEDIDVMYTKLSSLAAPDEVKKEIGRQINRLERMSADSMEAAVTRNYLDWMFCLPWSHETIDNLDLEHAREVLNQDHYGLQDIKERILDFISVRTLKRDGNTPIICFVGPPGTGKTSLGKSIARCLGRQYFRVSLGGVKDEAEIRGHRRTYVGAMPGRFIQGFKKIESCNPVIIIDELDKIGSDFRGDPSAAMLEVLDPQQNQTFYDNYLGVPFDLSRAMFIATANGLDTISEPLKDRMEIIQLAGYTLDEKVNIAKQYLVKRAVNGAGLDNYNFELSDTMLEDVVTNYTKEAGVRNLERLISTLCSKAARTYVEQNEVPSFSHTNIEQYLGPRKFVEDSVCTDNKVGITNGLAWTSYGGEMIKIEAVAVPGKGKLTLTGQLGNVMKESAHAALTYARAHASEFRIDPKMFTHYDLHIHVPAGAIPKDGPSAGITMLSSILSALTQRPIHAAYAMTGELNLRGEVMPIGGVKEKLLTAKRNKIPHVIMPLKNKRDLIGAEDLTKDINIIWVNHADEVLRHVLVEQETKRPRKS